MDEALKARKLGSVTARRQRLQERQAQKEQAQRDRPLRQRHIMYADRRTDISDDDSVSSISSNLDLDLDLDFTAETPSEYSVRTPDELSPELERAGQDVQITLGSSMPDVIMETVVTKHEQDNADTALAKLQVQPKMQATLTTMADWSYDRFSMLVDPIDTEEEQEEDEAALSSSSEEELDTLSPIEVAVPVAYSLPQSRPAVVRIITTQGRSQSLKLNKSNTTRPACRRHVSEQLLSNASHQGFQADETRLFTTSNSSRETISSANDSIAPSLSVSQASHDTNSFVGSASQTSQSDHSHRSPKRKSSLPLLFAANKGGHSRMSSIKKFIRSSTLGPLTSGPQFGGMLQRHPTTSTLETHFENQRSSMEQVRESIVEETVRPPSPQFSEQMTAMPPPVWPVRAESRIKSATVNAESGGDKASRKGRQRSGSIGQALRGLGSGPKKSDSSMPPVPTIHIPPLSLPESSDFSSTPPPLTPRNPRRTSNYSPFPAMDKRTSAVGLGLRY